MIKQEEREFNGKMFKYTYSTDGYRLRKVGTDEIYDDVYDILESNYEYEETEEKVEVDDGTAGNGLGA